MLDTGTTVEKTLETEVCRSEKRAGKKESIVLRGDFSTDDGRYQFEIKSDGTGEIFYSDFTGDVEEFAHEVEVDKLAREIEEAIREQIALQLEQDALDDAKVTSIREELSAEMLEEVFWEEINQTLEDPFFRSCYDDEEWGRSFSARAARLKIF